MILLSYSNSSIKGTEIFGSILYLSLLRPAIFACVKSGRKLIFNFNSWLSFQRLCRLLQEYQFNFVMNNAGSNTVLLTLLISSTLLCFITII